jgi:hypothetical protein
MTYDDAYVTVCQIAERKRLLNIEPERSMGGILLPWQAIREKELRDLLHAVDWDAMRRALEKGPNDS